MLVIGGGIMGLWAAVKAAATGRIVVLVDKGRIGGGASGGLLGALFPWMPERWDKRKQFQFEALADLPDELKSLEAVTGLSARYRRTGRLIPLPKPHLRDLALGLKQDALANWVIGKERFYWHVLDKSPVAGWPDNTIAAHGFAEDTLAACLDPRATIGLLKGWLNLQPNVRLDENRALLALEPKIGRAIFDGQTIGFGHAVIAAGIEAFPMLTDMLPPVFKAPGQAVKGQAAMLAADVDPSWPVIFLDGLYVVAHEGGRVAVGSTSENSFAEPFSTDFQLDDLVERARQILPVLRDAPVIERWAGLRPKAVGRDPMTGPLPDHSNIIALAGGFKISFGIAHKLAGCVIDFMDAHAPVGLPESFTVEAHMAKM